jgi:hypothetical protein
MNGVMPLSLGTNLFWLFIRVFACLDARLQRFKIGVCAGATFQSFYRGGEGLITQQQHKHCLLLQKRKARLCRMGMCVVSS